MHTLRRLLHDLLYKCVGDLDEDAFVVKRSQCRPFPRRRCVLYSNTNLRLYGLDGDVDPAAVVRCEIAPSGLQQLPQLGRVLDQGLDLIKLQPSTVSNCLLSPITKVESISSAPSLPSNLLSSFAFLTYSSITAMVYQLAIFGSRKPGMSPEEFKDHMETKHVPLIRELAGKDFPISHKRFYYARGPTGDLTTVFGQEYPFPWDAMVVITFEDEEHVKRYMGILKDEDKAKRLHADEERFLDMSTVKGIVIGDVSESTP